MKRPLRIAVMASVRWFNACAQVALQTAVGLRDRGHRVLLVVQPGSPLEERARAAGLVVESGMDLTATNPGRFVQHLSGLKRVLAGFKPHLVNAHRSEDHLLAAIALRRTGVPLVRTRGDVRAPRTGMGNRLLYGRATAAHIACAGFMRARFYEPLGVPAERVHLIRPGLDVETFSAQAPDQAAARASLGLDPKKRWVGLIGRYTAAKGHSVLVEAFSRLSADAGVHLLLSGDANEISSDDLDSTSRSFGVADRVCVRPRCASSQIALRALDLLSVPSVASEAISRIAMEGLALGIPTVVSDLNALPEVAGEAALVAPPGDTRAWADALSRGLTDRTFRVAARDAGPNRIREHYDADEQILLTEDLFRHLVREGE